MNAIEQFHFIRPFWLLAIPLVLVLSYILHRAKHKQNGWQPILAGHLLKHIVTHPNQPKRRNHFIGLALLWIIACLALAGPSWTKLPQPVFEVQQGRVVVLDMSVSMRATDLTPDRLTRTRFKAIDLINQFEDGETGLVAYAGDAFTISPLSNDSSNLLSMIPSLSPEIMPVEGDDPYRGIQQAQHLLSSAGYNKGHIYWLTDGIESNQVNELQKLIGKHNYRVSVLAIGSSDGAPITLSSGELYKDGDGNIVIPKLAARHLRAIANKGRGTFTTISNDNRDIESLAEQPVTAMNTPSTMVDTEQQTGDQWQDMGVYCVFLLLPFALYVFRRGVLTLLFVGIFSSILSHPVHADWWQSLWQTKNQQGAQAYAEQDFSQASEHFSDPLWKGIAHYRAGEFEQAAEIFATLNTPDGHYNLANSELQQGNLAQAISAYEDVLKTEPNHQDALFNKALAEKLLQDQQQDQQQQDQQQQDQQQQDQQQQDQQQDQQQQDQQQQDQQQQDQQQQDQQQQDQQQQDQQQQDQQRQDQQQQDQQQQDQQQEQEQQREQEQQQQQEQQQEQEQEQQQQQEQQQEQQLTAAEQQALTDEQKEQQQKMQLLLNKVKDDPAFLLRKRMELEYQRRKYDTQSRN